MSDLQHHLSLDPLARNQAILRMETGLDPLVPQIPAEELRDADEASWCGPYPRPQTLRSRRHYSEQENQEFARDRYNYMRHKTFVEGSFVTPWQLLQYNPSLSGTVGPPVVRDLDTSVRTNADQGPQSVDLDILSLPEAVAGPPDSPTHVSSSCTISEASDTAENDVDRPKAGIDGASFIAATIAKRPLKEQSSEEVDPQCNIPNFIEDKSYTSPTKAIRGYSKDNLDNICGQILVEYPEEAPELPLKTLIDEVTIMIGPKGNPLRFLGTDFPDQISSRSQDTWLVVMLTQKFPRAKPKDFVDRMIVHHSRNTLSNRAWRFRNSHGIMSIETADGTPIRDMEIIDRLSNDQLNHNTCWELRSDKAGMRQNKSMVWQNVPCPEGNFATENDRIRCAAAELKQFREEAQKKLGNANRWRDMIPTCYRGTKRQIGAGLVPGPKKPRTRRPAKK